MTHSIESKRVFKLSLFFFLVWVGTDEIGGQEDAIDKSSVTNTESELIEIKLFDDEKIKGKVYLPKMEEDQQVRSLVIFVPGTGPATYLNKRPRVDGTFNYFDQFGNEFAQRGIAMFSFNKRGVTIGKKPPMFDEVDRNKFSKSVPSNEIRDLESMVNHIKSDKRFKKSKIILLGWSEGSIISPLFAEHYPDKVDALLLAGYANDDMLDIMRYQHGGKGSTLSLNPIFDKNKDGVISVAEYESDDSRPKKYRERVLQGSPFKLLDANQDESLTASDFADRLKFRYSAIESNVKQRNADWIWDYYFRITPEWFDEHFCLEANKTRLPKLKLPIHIFHGTRDQNLPVQGVRDIQARFDMLGKSNLETHIFEDHDHDLNFGQWIHKNNMPAGIAKMMEIAEGLSQE